MNSRLAIAVSTALLAVSVGTACRGDDDGNGGKGPFELVVHPEFVQGMYANQPVTILVAIEEEVEGGGPVELTVDSDKAEVSVVPRDISAGQVAEVTITAGPVVEEEEIGVTVSARRGETERSLTKQVIVMPGEDDREPMARDILALFLPWLEANHPEFELGPNSELDGMFVAPRLLVVSHYAFFNESYEIGIGWHIMVQPDDWADIYVRPRDDLRPTAAFRLSSWGAALEGGQFTIAPTTIPKEVVR
jgi:hypothetical protein